MTNSRESKLLWTIRDVAHAVSLSPSTIRRRLVEGTFPSPRKGRRGSPLLWDPEDVRRWARKREN